MIFNTWKIMLRLLPIIGGCVVAEAGQTNVFASSLARYGIFTPSRSVSAGDWYAGTAGGLAGWWPMTANASNGTIAFSADKYGVDLRATNSATAPVFSNGEYLFDGTNDMLIADGSYASASGTIFFVAAHTNDGNQIAFSVCAPGNTNSLQLYLTRNPLSNKLQYLVRTNSFIQSFYYGSSVWTAGQMAVVAAVQSGTDFKLFFDGTQQVLYANTAISQSNRAAWITADMTRVIVGDRWLAANPPALPWAGKFNGVMIYNRAFSDLEVTNMTRMLKQ